MTVPVYSSGRNREVQTMRCPKCNSPMLEIPAA
jgi:Zn finger protein HypA/HybF involved in hydrogenase expression